MAVSFSFPCAAWARPYASRRMLYVLGSIVAVFLVLFNFAPHTLPPVIGPGAGYPDSSYQSPDKWTPPILSNSKSRPPPEWDANGDCLFLSPFDALSDKEKALANEIEFDVVSPGNVRLKNHTGEVPSDIKANPILKLLRDGEEKWNRVMKSQSKNLAEAVAKYEDKWGRPPPKGFDQWWLFARARNTLLIDEFDSIMESLLPYYGLPKEIMFERAKEAEKIEETYTLIVKDGKVEIQWNDDYARKQWTISPWRAQDQVKLMEPFLHLLHDFRATFTIHDQPSVQLEAGPQKELVDAALAHTVVKFPQDKDHFHRDWKKMCPEDSPLRRGEVETHGPGTFIHDHLPAMDPCTHPSIMAKHGMFLEVHDENSHPKPHNTLYPIFALFKTALNGDILVTPYFKTGRHDVGYDPKWHEKKGKLYWRGRPTGMDHNKGSSSEWRHSQRERLHWLANSKSSEGMTIMEPKGADGAARMVEYPEKKLGEHYVDAKLVGGPWQCDRDDGTCDEMAAEIDFGKLEGGDKANEFKYILDVDGNAWSSRFPRLLSSLNVVIKSTVFPEWFSHILPEWYAYVPTKVDYSDLYSILAFFRGSMDGKGGHDEVARRIALNGQCWAEKTLRYEDLQVYMFRLYLEYARLTSPDRDNGKMDFVLQDYHRDSSSKAENAGAEIGKLEAMPGIDERRRRRNL